MMLRVPGLQENVIGIEGRVFTRDNLLALWNRCG